MANRKYKLKKISKGHYEYRGCKIDCVGYYSPEQRVCWECTYTDGSAIFLKVDKVVLYQNVDLGETEFTYSRGIKLFVACNINDALNVFDTNYIEITEDEYNKLKKQAIETITDNETNEKI